MKIIIIVDKAYIPAGVKHDFPQDSPVEVLDKAFLSDDLSIVLHGKLHAPLLQDLSSLHAGKVKQVAHRAQVDVSSCNYAFFTQILQPLYHVLVSQAN